MNQTATPTAQDWRARATALAINGQAFIDGRYVAAASGETFEDITPIDGRVIARVAATDKVDVERAVAAARRSFDSGTWSKQPPRERKRVLQRFAELILAHRDELALLETLDMGKPISDSLAVDIPATARCIAWYAEAVDKVYDEVAPTAHDQLALITREPIGVVAAIVPWNFPLIMAAWKIGPALAAGNAVVLKPAPATTQIGLAIGELIRRAGLPAGVVNVVACDDEVAASLVVDPRLGKIVFTGSVPTGKRIAAAAAANVTPVLLELGGKDAAIVCRDADLDRTAAGLVWGAFMNAGQTCASIERVYVEEAIASALVAKLAELTRALRVGDPFDEATDVGPLTLERQRRLVEGHVQDALARGARALTGGARLEREGFFFPPTVLTGVDHSMQAMREETFGPTLPIMAVKDADEALRLANDSEYGLTASVWTRSAATAERLAHRLEAGVVLINDHLSSAGEPTAPWGGYKKSGFGRVHGAHGLRELARVKYVATEASRRPAIWWYPYGAGFRRFVETALPAFHGRPLARVAALARLGLHRRFWSRFGPWSFLKGLDRLF
jgi:acyl-CoA reductase-like NAD-dependent aldehyde dehydrogenase